MKKRKFSKVIAVALAALMVVGMVPMMALADGEPGLSKYNNEIDSEYYNTNIVYENGNDEDYGFINFEYTGVNKDGTITADDVNGVNITMSDGDGWSETADSNSLGWAHNLVASSHYDENASNNYEYVGTYGSGYYSLSQNNENKWSAVAVDKETGIEYTLTMDGFNTKSADTVTDIPGSSMETTISGELPEGEYTLTVSWYFQMKHYDYNYMEIFGAIIETSSYHSASEIEGTDTFNLIVEHSDAVTEELGDGIKKITDGNAISFTGGNDSTVVFDVPTGIYNTDEEGNQLEEVKVENISAEDTVNVNFSYDGVENDVMTISELDDGILAIVNDGSTYAASVTVDYDMIKSVLEGMGVWEDVLNELGGSENIVRIALVAMLNLPLTIYGENCTITPTYTITATDVTDQSKTYSLPVTYEEGVGATYSAADLPVGEYTITINYKFDFGFDYSYETPEAINSIIAAFGMDAIILADTIPSENTKSQRSITSSDSFTLTITPCPHTNVDVVNAEDPTCAVGNYDYVYCEDCGRYWMYDENEEDYMEVAFDDVIIPATGDHNWDEDLSTPYVAPTCTEDGAYATKTCAVCDNKYLFDENDELVKGNIAAEEGEEIINALGHDYELTETVDPACTADGKNIYTCTRCQDEQEEPIPMLGHTPAAAVKENEVPAEVGVEGSYDEVVYCEVCGEELSRETRSIDALEPEPEGMPDGVTKSVENTDVTYTIDGDYVIDIVANVFGFDISLSDIPTTQSGSIVLSYEGLGDIASGATLTFVPEFDTSAFALTAVVELDALGDWASMVEAFYTDWPYIVDEGSIDGYSVAANWISATATNVETGAVTPIEIVVGEDGVATFSVAGLEDGEYEITIDYDLSIITDLNLLGLIQASVETMSIPNCSDTFTITVSGEAVVPAPGEDEPCEHEFYVVDSAEATCEDEGWVLYACSECGEQFVQYTAALGHDFVDGVCARCGALEEEAGTTAGSGSSSKAASTTSEDEEDEDEFTEAEDENEFTEVEEDEFDVASDESTTSPSTGASMAAVGAAMAFAAAGIVVVTRKKKEED